MPFIPAIVAGVAAAAEAGAAAATAAAATVAEVAGSAGTAITTAATTAARVGVQVAGTVGRTAAQGAKAAVEGAKTAAGAAKEAVPDIAKEAAGRNFARVGEAGQAATQGVKSAAQMAKEAIPQTAKDAAARNFARVGEAGQAAKNFFTTAPKAGEVPKANVPRTAEAGPKPAETPPTPREPLKPGNPAGTRTTFGNNFKTTTTVKRGAPPETTHTIKPEFTNPGKFEKFQGTQFSHINEEGEHVFTGARGRQPVPLSAAEREQVAAETERFNSGKPLHGQPEAGAAPKPTAPVRQPGWAGSHYNPATWSTATRTAVGLGAVGTVLPLAIAGGVGDAKKRQAAAQVQQAQQQPADMADHDDGEDGFDTFEPMGHPTNALWTH